MAYLYFSLPAAILIFAGTSIVSKKPVLSSIAALFGFAFIHLVVWAAMPTLDIRSVGLWFNIFVVLVWIIGSGFLFVTDSEQGKLPRLLSALTLGAIMAFLTFCLIVFFTTSSMFNATAYRDLLGKVEEKTVSADFQPFDQSQSIFVDYGNALARAEELLGKEPGLGSRVQIGHMNRQMVNGKFQYIAPLEHTGAMQWLNNDFTPGYVRVSGNDRRDAEIVLTRKMRYLTSGCFGDSIERHLYTNGYANKFLDDYSFEIDDSGEPYWVVTVYEPKVGFSGSDAIGVVTVHAETGAIKEFTLAEAPAWIDRIQPQDFIAEQIAMWGQYQNGYWNATWLGSKDGVTMPTEGINSIPMADGRQVWYTGIQSRGNDKGTVGYMLVDTRTKQATFYRQLGVTEDGAKEAVQGRVQEKGYTSSYPIPYLIAGVPTFVSILNDKNGIRQAIAMLSVQNRTTIGIGETPQAALRAYMSSMRQQNAGQALEGVGAEQSFAGNVVRFASEVVDGNTAYYLVIGGVPNRIFRVPALMNVKTPLTRIEDSVEVGAFDTEGAVIDVTRFDNLNIDAVKSVTQKKTDAAYSNVDTK